LTDIVNTCGNRYVLFCGVDDLILEASLLGAVGWVAGLVNAFPHETMRLWRLAEAGNWTEARELYRWFTPVLHLDCHVKLVQYIKLAQAMAGLGSETVRAPRLPLVGDERRRVTEIVQQALESRPGLAAE
jgi:4-hydroxy-tetrahydrodipicolinate synthase